MPFFIPALLGAIGTVMGSLVGRVLLALGISFISFSGITKITSISMDMVKNSMGGLPTEVLALVAYMWIDKALTLYFSAVVAAFAIRLGGSDTLTSMVIKK